MRTGLFGRRARACDAPVLSIVHITVRAGKLDFELSCDAERLHVDAGTAARVLEALPNLARHVCVNRRGERFGDEVEGTEAAHLFEHVAIELLGQAFPEQAAHSAFRGYTTYADAAPGGLEAGAVAMRTTISCADDLSAMCAAREALHVVNWAFGTSGRASGHGPGGKPGKEAAAPPDIEAMVRAVASASRELPC